MLPWLPHEIIFLHILPKLPVKSLLRFNSVSKLWCNTIHHPNFMATHLSHGKSNPSPVAILGFEQNFYRFIRLETELHHDNASLDLRLGVSAIYVVGHSNGLTCSCCSSSVIHVSNPSTRELLTISQPKLSNSMMTYFWHMHGFGFDPVMNEYKVIQIWFDHISGYYGIWVYTLGTNSWRNITFTCNYPPYTFPAHFQPICISGVLYWQTVEYGKILSFDLRLEKFQLVPCPKVPQVPGLICYGLFELLGCLCLLFCHDDNLIKDGVQLILYAKRVMHTEQQQQQQEEASSSSCWIRQRNCIRLPFKPDTEIIQIIAHSEQLYLQWNTKDGDFIWYNVYKKIIQKKKLSGLERFQVVLVNHVENFLSLKTFVPPSSAGELKVKYVSSRKANHESPTATSCSSSDQHRQPREKKHRRGVTPCWFPIILD